MKTQQPLQGHSAIRPGDGGIPRSVTRGVVDAIYELFRSGALKDGDRLPSEWELVRELSVGRSAVREAVRELAALGIVETQQGRGSFVRSLPPEIMASPETFSRHLDRAVRAELGEVRRIFEPEAAAIAAVRATRQAIERLGADVDALSAAVAEGVRPPEDLGFHLDIVGATRKNYLSRLATVIVSYYEHDDDVPSRRDIVEHRAVFEAIRRRSGVDARRAMMKHLKTQERNYRPN